MSSSPQISIRSLENQKRDKTPPSFWDNLPRQVLVPRALREFDRRTRKYHLPIPPQSPSLRSGRNSRALKHFARLGGPSLADLRGYHRALSSKPEDRSESTNPGNMGKTKYDDAFDLYLTEHRIFIDNTDVEPENRAAIMSKLAAKRPESEESRLTTERFKRFQDVNKIALQDATVMSSVLPMIAGVADSTTANNLLIGDLEHLTDGSISKPVASCCDGLLLNQIDPQIRKDLGHYIIPSIKTSRLCLPNFFVEVSRDWKVAKRQGFHCGAMGARGVCHLRSYFNRATASDNNAYTIVATYNAQGLLQLFTVHLARFGRDDTAYYMTLLGTFPVCDSLEWFRTGVRAFRNVREWAKEQRETLADAANAKVKAPLPPFIHQNELTDKICIA